MSMKNKEPNEENCDMKITMPEIQRLNGQRKNYVIFNTQRAQARYPDAVYVTASVQKDPC